MEKQTYYSISNSKSTTSTQQLGTTLSNSFPCILNKHGHPNKAPINDWNSVQISIPKIPPNCKSRDIINLFVKQIPLTSSQLLYIKEGFDLPKFYLNIKTTERVSDFRKNCARNKWGRMYHYKGNEKCRLCNEKNNSMHIIYCHEINQLEITLTGDVQVVITRIKASKDHKSTHHTHSWIINKARWNLNNKILYNNNDEVKHPIYQLYFFKQQIKLLEYDHLQLVCHKYAKINAEQLSLFRYFTIKNNKVFPKPLKSYQF